jgi:hypothetical protein
MPERVIYDLNPIQSSRACDVCEGAVKRPLSFAIGFPSTNSRPPKQTKFKCINTNLEFRAPISHLN